MDGPYTLTRDESAALTRRITSLSVVTAAVLTVLKALVWFASDSVSILASLADSGLDLLAALGTFFAVRYAAAPPLSPPYVRQGGGVREPGAGGLVFASAALIGQEAIRHRSRPTPMAQSGRALGVMAISTLDRGSDQRSDPGAAQGARSVAVTGDRAHYAADLVSNMVALAAIAATALIGFWRL
jgi:divalent metal cation (Fe/Co/Zn/Cd) transporter